MRRFEFSDQEFFARLSGDWNPMHMESVAARRTQAGFPVVHGMHVLLWSLDVIGGKLSQPLRFGSVIARFPHFLYLMDEAECIVQPVKAGKVKWRVVANGIPVLKGSAVFRSVPSLGSADADADESTHTELVREAPVSMSFDQAAQMRGRVSFASLRDVAAAFPNAAILTGACGAAAIVSASKLVGMVCPGLHSIFSSISLAFQGPGGDSAELEYQVVETDERFNLLQISIAGGGTAGEIEAFVRGEPVIQPGLAEIAPFVRQGEFAGQTALVIGASRGLGELAAKVVAAGGGRVVGTYASGREEAVALSRQVEEFRGECQILKYDARLPPAGQLRDMKWVPTQLFYFATPQISRQKESALDRAVLNEFLEFYLYGFFDLCQFLLARTAEPMSVYYPSSIYIGSRPANFAEYAIAKASGEIIGEELARLSTRMKVLHTRLPLLATDQTNAVGVEAAPSALPEMLKVVRQLTLLTSQPAETCDCTA